MPPVHREVVAIVVVILQEGANDPILSLHLLPMNDTERLHARFSHGNTAYSLRIPRPFATQNRDAHADYHTGDAVLFRRNPGGIG